MNNHPAEESSDWNNHEAGIPISRKCCLQTNLNVLKKTSEERERERGIQLDCDDEGIQLDYSEGIRLDCGEGIQLGL